MAGTNSFPPATRGCGVWLKVSLYKLIYAIQPTIGSCGRGCLTEPIKMPTALQLCQPPWCCPCGRGCLTELITLGTLVQSCMPQ
eukprot:1153658-Pelagomonas_calceolata.AAC.2